MEQKICQCCAMPIDETTFGTEADGSKNEEYCQYCYADGHFTKECTMDEMIELNLNYLEEFNKDSEVKYTIDCLLYTSPSPRDRQKSRMPSSA